MANETAAKKKNNLFLDTNAIFMKEMQASGNESSFFITGSTPNDSHPSEKGHRLIARIIYDYLNEKKLLPAELLGLNARKIYTYKWEN
jgi:lysophospholipase L1-like esterase